MASGLTIAYRKNAPGPEKFESAPGSGVTLLELKRSETIPEKVAVPAPDDSKAKSERSRKVVDKSEKRNLPAVNPAADLKALRKVHGPSRNSKRENRRTDCQPQDRLRSTSRGSTDWSFTDGTSIL